MKNTNMKTRATGNSQRREIERLPMQQRLSWPSRRSAGSGRDRARARDRDPSDRTDSRSKVRMSVMRRSPRSAARRAARSPWRRCTIRVATASSGSTMAQHLLEFLHVLGVVLAVIEQELERHPRAGRGGVCAMRPHSCALIEPSPSMINIAPSRPNGLGFDASWNIQADSASEPMFFSAPWIVGERPAGSRRSRPPASGSRDAR